MDVHASRENLIQLISILFDNAVKYAARAIALAYGGTLGASYEKDDIICFTLRLKEP